MEWIHDLRAEKQPDGHMVTVWRGGRIAGEVIVRRPVDATDLTTRWRGTALTCAVRRVA